MASKSQFALQRYSFFLFPTHSFSIKLNTIQFNCILSEIILFFQTTSIFLRIHLVFPKKRHNFGHKFKIKDNMAEKSLSQVIKERIIQNGEKRMYVNSDFADLQNDVLVSKVLSRLEAEGVLVRITQGLYLYPKRTKYGIVMPTLFEIAQAISEKEHAHVIPSGMTALNKLGLSTQVPMNAVYITDGTPRKLTIGNQTITFKRATPKMFSYQSTLFPLIVSAMKELGEKGVGDDVVEHISKVLEKEDDRKALRHDYMMAPQWIRKRLNTISI
jgi:hypothetical protein